MSAKEEAIKTIVEMVSEILPIKLTPDQRTELQEKAYDLVGQLMDAVAESYHVVYKH